MNKLFFILVVAVCAPMSLLAQSASKVGVNTREPSENLHVKGTVRVEKLPVDGEILFILIVQAKILLLQTINFLQRRWWWPMNMVC